MSPTPTPERLLHLLRDAPGPQRTGEIAKRAHLSVTTVRMHLRDLVYEGLVVRRIEPGATMDTAYWSVAVPERGRPPSCDHILCSRCVADVYEDSIRYHRSLTADTEERRQAWIERTGEAIDALGENDEAPGWVDEGPRCERCGKPCGYTY